MRTPLQIIVLRDPRDRRTDVYVDTLRLAFEGSADPVGTPSAYLAEAVDLGIRVLEPAEAMRDAEVRRLAGGARHTVIVVIGDAAERSGILIEIVGEKNFVWVPAPAVATSGNIQGEKARDGVEPAFAPIVVALRTMERARRALVRRKETDEGVVGSLKLFISHAKVDGVAMARSLIGVLRQLREVSGPQAGFDYFYDAEHIEPGTVWREVLEAEARQSVLIALRTESYESRYWCRREFILAERSGMPILVVDLRKEQFYDCALLPFDVAPSVRVYDGNLIRVVLHAMAAHLRALRVRSEAPADVKVLPHRPSVYSLDSASQAAREIHAIAYPAPKLSDAYTRAVQPMLIRGGVSLDLLTFDELGSN